MSCIFLFLYFCFYFHVLYLIKRNVDHMHYGVHKMFFKIKKFLLSPFIELIKIYYIFVMKKNVDHRTTYNFNERLQLLLLRSLCYIQ